MAKENEILNRYIEKIDQIQKSESSLNESDLITVAEEIGLSDTDLQKIEKKAVAYMERGKGFISSRYWDDAIRELSDARSLKPFNPQVHYLLANAYQERYFGLKNDRDRLMSEQSARECIRLDPGCKAAYEILKRLTVTPDKKKRKTGLWITALIFAFSLLLAFTFFCNSPISSDRDPPPRPDPIEIPGPF